MSITNYYKVEGFGRDQKLVEQAIKVLSKMEGLPENGTLLFRNLDSAHEFLEKIIGLVPAPSLTRFPEDVEEEIQKELGPKNRGKTSPRIEIQSKFSNPPLVLEEPLRGQDRLYMVEWPVLVRALAEFEEIESVVVEGKKYFRSEKVMRETSWHLTGDSFIVMLSISSHTLSIL